MSKAKTVREKIEALSSTDREILDRVGAGETSNFTPIDYKSLIQLNRLGLVEVYGHGVIETGPMKGATYPLWQTTAPADIEWCQICSEEIEDAAH
jgi:hypothetical protein